MRAEAWMAVAGIGASFITAVAGVVLAAMNRPKMSAETKAANATGETSMSADAREWTNTFREETRQAKAEAVAAAERAKNAEDRLDELEDKMTRLATYTRTLQVSIIDLGGHPPAPPEDLIPPLSRP